MFAVRADAEDVVQDALVKALAGIKRFEPTGSLAGWLSVIALNTARKRLRGVRRTLVEPSRDLDARREIQTEPAPSAHESLECAELTRALRVALAELPEREREVVQLRYGAELPAAEVARSLGLTDANVRKIAERARAVLEARIVELTRGESVR